MYLDCASFHLCTGRAFELSRRKMLEANVIVTTLTKELAFKKKITKKSDSPHVKEVCRNYLKVDQAANNRMSSDP